MFRSRTTEPSRQRSRTVSNINDYFLLISVVPESIDPERKTAAPVPYVGIFKGFALIYGILHAFF